MSLYKQAFSNMKNTFQNKFHSKNERVKYAYRMFLKNVRQRDEKTIHASLQHIRRYEIYNNFSGFEAFNANIAFKYIESLINEDLSLSYVSDNVRSIKSFFEWLQHQRGYRSKINYNDIQYLNISKNQRKEAKAMEYQKSYSFEEIINTIRSMLGNTLTQRRDKAIISLQALCTLRISELRTVKIKSIIEENGVYFVDVCPRHMKVKFAKPRLAVFVGLPDDVKQNVLEWRDYLLKVGFSKNDPLFPKIDNRFTQANLIEKTLQKKEIKSDTTIRNVFKNAFKNAKYEYINPHSFRKTLARYAQTQSPSFLNAVRQNLGHESIDTTLNSYGKLSHLDQREIISIIKISGGNEIFKIKDNSVHQFHSLPDQG